MMPATNSTDGDNRRSDVAVIGMALRFPGADTPEAFWSNLAQGIDSISVYTDAQLLAEGVNPEFLSDQNYVKAGGFPRDFKHFSPEFFGFSGREAELIDPQQRVALECVHEALERAACDPSRFGGRIAVYAGAATSDHRAHVLANIDELDATEYFLARLGNDNDFVATRISYKLNLRGPSMTVQTACSTSLVAVHLACRSLQSGESDISIAGGVSIDSLNLEGYFYMEGGILSPDGRCRAFDADAQGTVFTKGAGFLVLKRLSDALRDRDNIIAIIKGSAINNDGNSKVGYFAPSVEGQAEVVTAALADAGIRASSVSYIEAHGTATPLGDPVEIEALTRVFRKDTNAVQFCAVGSVKTNIGHPNTSAGVAGLIKACLALQHGQIPPMAHFNRHNPRINFESSPFFVNDALLDWRPGSGPRRAGVTSLGVGGTNAHVIVEEPPGRAPTSPRSPCAHIIPLSAKDPEALARIQNNLAEHIAKNPGISVADVAFTLQLGRTQFAHRVAYVIDDDAEELIQRLRSNQKGISGSEPAVIFVLPGSGLFHAGMARDLYEVDAGFRTDLDTCIAGFQASTGTDLSSSFRTTDGLNVKNAPRGPAEAEAALFCLEYALARLLIRWNVRPQAILGYGVGELVAAVLSGVFDLDTALRLLSTRAKWTAKMAGGRLIEVPRGCHERTVESVLVRAYETERTVGFVGEKRTIHDIVDDLIDQGVPVTLLGAAMIPDPALLEGYSADVAQMLGSLSLGSPSLPVISGWSGRWWSEPGAMGSGYWSDYLRRDLSLASARDELRRHFPSADVVQLGPSKRIGDMFARTSAEGLPRHLMVLGDVGALDARPDMLKVLACAWERGASVHWEDLARSTDGRRVVLPTYPFQRRLVWFSREETAMVGGREAITTKPDRVTAVRSPGRTIPMREGAVAGNATSRHPQADSSVGARPTNVEVLTKSSTVVKPAAENRTVLRKLVELCQETLKVAIEDPAKTFLEFGGDSIRATKFVWSVEKAFGARLEIEDVLTKSLVLLAQSLNDVSHETAETSPAEAGTVVTALCQLCRQSLKVDSVQPEQTFLDCGGDSIRATQFIWLVEKQFKVRLELEKVLSKSIGQLADAVQESMSDMHRAARTATAP